MFNLFTTLLRNGSYSFTLFHFGKGPVYQKHPFITNKSLSSSTSPLHIKREKIPHILINLGMFCHDPCQRLLLKRYTDAKQSCLPLHLGTVRAE